MTLHLVKLCVGADSIADHEAWIKEKLAAMKARGETPEQRHTTRMVPKRVAELLDGGSIYWVIKGQIASRQEILDVRPFTDGEGVSRCHLVLKPKVIPVPRAACAPSRAGATSRHEAPPDSGGLVRNRRHAGGDAAELRELGCFRRALRFRAGARSISTKRSHAEEARTHWPKGDAAVSSGATQGGGFVSRNDRPHPRRAGGLARAADLRPRRHHEPAADVGPRAVAAG